MAKKKFTKKVSDFFFKREMFVGYESPTTIWAINLTLMEIIAVTVAIYAIRHWALA